MVVAAGLNSASRAGENPARDPAASVPRLGDRATNYYYCPAAPEAHPVVSWARLSTVNEAHSDFREAGTYR